MPPPEFVNTLKRLVREFSLPAIAAAMWTGFAFWHVPGAIPWKAAVGAFSASFFFVSWATGQYFRVRKQAALDTNLSRIEDRLAALIATLEQRTKDLIGYATGGDAMIGILPMITGPESITLSILNECNYPVFDIQLEYIDLDEPIDPAAGKLWTRRSFVVPALWPHKLIHAIPFQMQGRERLRINIFIQTRSSGAIAQLHVARAEDSFRIATKFESAAEKKINVPEDFPGIDPTDPEAAFK